MREWLLLLHHLPPQPLYLRAMVRRRLKRLGAMPLKRAAYLLPDTDESLEDLEWLRREILDRGGQAWIFRVEALAGLDTRSVERALRDETPVEGSPSGGFRGARWVTRRGVKHDRMASAWLIRRFIDPEARFDFVDATRYRHVAGDIRFDMFEGEHTHEAGRCTFEVLLARFGLVDPGLRALGEIIHDIDLKDERHRRPETAGVAALLDGIITRHDEDGRRLDDSAPLFDALHARLGKSP